MPELRFKEPRAVFLALPFEARDKVSGYREALALVEDRFNVKIKHGDSMPDAVGILERATAIMIASRMQIFDLTSYNPNVVFEFGIAKGSGLRNLYAFRRKSMFGTSEVPSMINNIDCALYSGSEGLEKVLTNFLQRHFWPSDVAFTEEHIPWLIDQIRDLTFPVCETDRLELEVATGIHRLFVTQAVRHFVDAGDAIALSVGPSPRYRFDFNSLRPVPGSGAAAKRRA